MGDNDSIFVFEPLKKLGRGMTVIFRKCPVGYEGPAGPVDRAPFMAVPDIMIAAKTGIARPFVARDGQKLSRLLEFPGEVIKLFPKRIGDLEVVALVPCNIEKGLVPGEEKIVPCRIGPYGLLALPVHVAPRNGQTIPLG